MNGEKRPFTLGLILVLFASFGYGIMPALTQKAFAAGVAVETVLSSRYILGAPLLWLYVVLRRNKLFIGARNTAFIFCAGLNMVIFVIALNEAYKRLPGFIASLIVFMYVIFVVAVEILTGREKPYISRIVCLAVSFVGLVAVVWTPNSGGGELSLVGIALALAAALTYAAATMIMGARRLAAVRAEVVTGYLFFLPAVFSILRSLATAHPLLPHEPFPFLVVAVLGLWVGCLSPIAFCRAVKLIGPGSASMINASEPVIAYFAGALLMSDRVSAPASAGGFLIIAAILAFNVTERLREKTRPDRGGSG